MGEAAGDADEEVGVARGGADRRGDRGRLFPRSATGEGEHQFDLALDVSFIEAGGAFPKFPRLFEPGSRLLPIPGHRFDNAEAVAFHGDVPDLIDVVFVERKHAAIDRQRALEVATGPVEVSRPQADVAMVAQGAGEFDLCTEILAVGRQDLLVGGQAAGVILPRLPDVPEQEG